MLITKSRHNTDMLITCKEFKLLRFESLELSLNIVLYPTSSPSGLFWNHLFYTAHSVYFFNSAFKIYPKSVYFSPPSLLPVTGRCFPHWVPSPLLSLWSIVSSPQGNQNFSFKITIRMSHSFAKKHSFPKNLPVTLVEPTRPCMIVHLLML